ncbi:MAG: ribosome-associated translation inhibitor RaiA [Coriobacteriia bacterium]
MDIIVKGRHMPVTDALRQYAEEKVGRAARIIDYMLKEGEVELWVEKNPAIEDNQVCEITLWTKGPVIRARESAPDMYAAIDMASEKLEGQLRKYKGKLVDRHTGKHGRSHEAESGIPEDVIEEAETRSVVKTKRVPAHPMTEDEAILQLELLGHDFFLFKHAETGAPTVLYRRADGDYGMIQAEDFVDAIATDGT